MDNIKLISGTSHPDLAISISKHLRTPLSECILEKYGNTEIKVELKENIRNKDIFIIQTGSYNNELGYSINDHLMETLIIIDACKRSMAKTITLIMPFYPYSRQDKKNESRAPITAKLIANVLETSGIDRIVIMDLHAPQIQGFFNIPVDNIYAMPLLIHKLNEMYLNNMTLEEMQSKFVLVGPDAGSIKRIIKFSKVMKLDPLFMHKQRNYKNSKIIDSMMLVGDKNLVKNKIAIVIDDICDTGGTLIKCCDILHKYGAKEIICVVTHNILSNNAIDLFNQYEHISKLIVSNTLPQNKHMRKCNKIEMFDVSNLFAKVISCIVTGDSISKLFLSKVYKQV